MSILEELGKKKVWEEFRTSKQERGQLTVQESRELDRFVEEERYVPIAADLSFGLPVKMVISKMDSQKKRTVYSYSEDETWVLKLLAHLLYRYDSAIPDSCYAFRRTKTAKHAINRIKRIKNLNEKYVLRTDIHDYFNSIDVDILMPILKDVLSDDSELLVFMETLLRQDACIWQGEVINEKRGAMAGVPLASFLANVYLMDLDRYFEDNDIPYCRYSDDIIAFFDSMDELNRYFETMNNKLAQKNLILNEKKTAVAGPGEPWEFLGFRYEKGQIDLSNGTIMKMKGRIKRKAHKLYRWRKRKDASFERAASAMIRSFDYRFYDLTGKNEFTWTRFYFPVITVADGLHEIDEYMVMYLRYLYSGRFNKGNYDISYDKLKSLGYTPLVAEYYNWKKETELLRKLNDKTDE